MQGERCNSLDDRDGGLITLKAAYQDLGWFWGLFTTIVGGPSLLSILQEVFAEYRLVVAFQWIVDGWNDLAAVAGAYVEPLIAPLINWANDQFDWRLTLQPSWRPLFALGMIFSLAMSREIWRWGHHVVSAFVFVVLALSALVAATISSLFPLSAGWWAQGLAAALPIGLINLSWGLASTAVAAPRAELAQTKEHLASMAVFTALTSGLGFLIAATMSVVPGIGGGEGILALAFAMGLLGAFITAAAIHGADRRTLRLGLTIVGGFIAAGLIVIADVLIKVFS